MLQAKPRSSKVSSSRGSSVEAERIANEELESSPCTDGGDVSTRDFHIEVGSDDGNLYDVRSQHDLPTHSAESTGVPFLHCGAQFGTDRSDPATHADIFTADVSASDTTMGSSGDASDVHEDQLGTFGLGPSTGAEGCLRHASVEDHHSQGFREIMLDSPSHAKHSFATQPSTGLPTNEGLCPNIIVLDEQGRPTLPAAGSFHDWPSDNLETPTHVVHNAQALAHAFYAQWLSRLAASPGVYARCAAYTPDYLFGIGLWTLQDCYRGAMPSSFERLLALMLVAFAFYNEKHQDRSCDCVGFARDIYRWHKALSEFSERNLFVVAWHRLWCPRECHKDVMAGSGLSNTSSYGPPSSIRDAMGAPAEEARCLLPPTESMEYTIAGEQGINSMARMIMGGLVMAGCSSFLDAVQYASINERNIKDPCGLPWEDTNDLVESVIQPLQQCHAAVWFPAFISGIMDKLRNGSIRNVRELEVTLISGNELSQLPLRGQRTYLDHVIVQCNKAKNQYSSAWRSEHYIASLDDVISLSSNPGQGHASVSSTLLQIDSLSRTSNPQLRYPGTPEINGNGTYTQSNNRHFTAARPPLPPVAFRASVDNNHPGNHAPDAWPSTLRNTDLTRLDSRSVVSSDLLSDDSPSSNQSVSEPSSHTTFTFTTCDRCPDKTFEGAPQNQRRNLRRHMRSAHDPHPRLECPAQGCSITFKAGRKDNLKRHVEQQHHQIVLTTNYFEYRNLING